MILMMEVYSYWHYHPFSWWHRSVIWCALKNKFER